MDEFSHLGMNTLIDKSLVLRSSYAGYQYSEIISSLFWIHYCGGDHIEYIGQHLGGHLELRPNTEIPSPDTLLRGIKELSEFDIYYTADRGLKYAFNKAKRLNNLIRMVNVTSSIYAPADGWLFKDKNERMASKIYLRVNTHIGVS